MSPFVRSNQVTAAILCLGIYFGFACGAGLPVRAFGQAGSATRATAVSGLPNMTAEQIVTRLGAANTKRAQDLRGFTGKRVYNLDYRGFPGHREANMAVVAQYSAPATKTFDIVSESGSQWIVDRVLKKLLEREKEAAQTANQRRTALTPENYRFTLLGTKPTKYGGCYRLQAEPVRDNKYLFRGEICVNGNDFAVELIDAEPAKNPSIWIKQTRIEHQYEKLGEFWLPASNQSVTNVLLGGTATLTIQYTDYKLETGQTNP
jgi:hypothetical protein